jgi:radical SAM superfamily enzyme YgiQ (UPF0313 family)
MGTVRIVLISTYELGRQPFGLASPTAWLRAKGHEVTQADVSRNPLPMPALAEADLVAFFLPMHTATRLFLRVIGRVRAAAPRAHLCAYGLYAPLNVNVLRHAGVGTVIGGEFEQPLVDLAERLSGESGAAPPANPEVSLARQQFLVPDRTGLPPLARYAQLTTATGTRRVGYTEATRGCKHLCRHCPVVPVYNGAFRVVQHDVVLEDIRRQVSAGAEHITFGDPDFFNGPAHAMRIVEELHREWPSLTYDVTIKVEHLLQQRRYLACLKRTGCAFVTTAVESFDDDVLTRLAKGHTQADFLEALSLMRAADLPLAPTFIPFTPWTTMESYRGFLRTLAELDMVEQVAPIQLAIRLLIPAGSLLFELPEVRTIVHPFDHVNLCYPWRNPDKAVDELQSAVQETVKKQERRRAGRSEIFSEIWDLAGCGEFPEIPLAARATIPYLTEPWYC